MAYKQLIWQAAWKLFLFSIDWLRSRFINNQSPKTKKQEAEDDYKKRQKTRDKIEKDPIDHFNDKFNRNDDSVRDKDGNAEKTNET